jgi:hypothetical protein
VLSLYYISISKVSRGNCNNLLSRRTLEADEGVDILDALDEAEEEEIALQEKYSMQKIVLVLCLPPDSVLLWCLAD